MHFLQMKFHTNLICQTIDVAGNSSHINDSLHSFCNVLGEMTSPLFKKKIFNNNLQNDRTNTKNN